jgi:hypothetical protein
MISDRFTQNPFHVLGLPRDCSRHDLERAAQRLIAELELSLSSAATYATPLGPRLRDVDQVRRAAAELRDPAKRAWHEIWARPPAREEQARVEPPRALAALGWKR